MLWLNKQFLNEQIIFLNESRLTNGKKIIKVHNEKQDK